MLRSVNRYLQIPTVWVRVPCCAWSAKAFVVEDPPFSSPPSTVFNVASLASINAGNGTNLIDFGAGTCKSGTTEDFSC
eukprot:3865852-Amphidinium_carterae.1